MGPKQDLTKSVGARKIGGAVSGSSARGRRTGPVLRIIKTRKPLLERKRNFHNSLMEDNIRKEYIREEGFDPFAPPTPGETINLYSDRRAAWEKVGNDGSGRIQGSGASTQAGSTLNSSRIGALY